MKIIHKASFLGLLIVSEFFWLVGGLALNASKALDKAADAQLDKVNGHA